MAPLQITSIMEESMDASPTRVAANSSMKRRRKTNLSVTFGRSVAVRETLHINNYAVEEKLATWYNRSELASIKSDIRTTILSWLEDKDRAESEDFCVRGTETFTPEGQALKKMHREDARDSVLEEQDYLWDNGFEDPDSIAELYFLTTRKPVALARVRGLAMEREVNPVHNVAVKLDIVKVSRDSFSRHSFTRTPSITALDTRGPRRFSSRAA